MQVENLGDGRVVGCDVLHFKPSALVWWSAENNQVSVAQFQIRESTDIHQSQGLFILANFGEPKWTVGSSVIFEVFNRRMIRVKANFLEGIVHGLTRVFDKHVKVRDVILLTSFTVFHHGEALDWTSDGHPSRRGICLSSAHI
jgi:hypothetical protein